MACFCTGNLAPRDQKKCINCVCALENAHGIDVWYIYSPVATQKHIAQLLRGFLQDAKKHSSSFSSCFHRTKRTAVLPFWIFHDHGRERQVPTFCASGGLHEVQRTIVILAFLFNQKKKIYSSLPGHCIDVNKSPIAPCHRPKIQQFLHHNKKKHPSMLLDTLIFHFIWSPQFKYTFTKKWISLQRRLPYVVYWYLGACRTHALYYWLFFGGMISIGAPILQAIGYDRKGVGERCFFGIYEFHLHFAKIRLSEIYEYHLVPLVWA